MYGRSILPSGFASASFSETALVSLLLSERRRSKASKWKFIALPLILEVEISYSDRKLALPEQVFLLRVF